MHPGSITFGSYGAEVERVEKLSTSITKWVYMYVPENLEKRVKKNIKLLCFIFPLKKIHKFRKHYSNCKSEIVKNMNTENRWDAYEMVTNNRLNGTASRLMMPSGIN